jgi:hypothetical protein
MLDRFDINPTQLTGLLSFGAATIVCLIAAQRSGARDAPTWRLLALTNCLFLIETYAGLRYHIANLARGIAEANDFYAKRTVMLESIDLFLAAIALVFVTLFLFRGHAASRGIRIAASITIALVALFAIESVSLHALDAVFYRPIGPVAVIGWLWALAAAGICLAATQS